MLRHFTAALILALWLTSTAADAAEPRAWTQHLGPVLTATQPWEQQEVQEPSVVYAGGRYRMWYTGANEARCMIGYAESTDGLTWTKPLDHPVIGWGWGGVAGNACHSNVQRLNGRYYAWFSIEDSVRGVTNGNLYGASSSDGINWQPLPKVAIRAGGWAKILANSFVVRDHGHWTMLWEAYGNGLWKMGSATSSDLVNWKVDRHVISAGFGTTFGGPWILPAKGGWTMYYHAAPPGVRDAPPFSVIYQATSTGNLTKWRTAPSPLVVLEQPDWQYDQVADPTVVTANGRTLMFFDGLDNRFPIRASIGVAELR